MYTGNMVWLTLGSNVKFHSSQNYKIYKKYYRYES